MKFLFLWKSNAILIILCLSISNINSIDSTNGIKLSECVDCKSKILYKE